jgi:hypothetical protein
MTLPRDTRDPHPVVAEPATTAPKPQSGAEKDAAVSHKNLNPARPRPPEEV